MTILVTGANGYIGTALVNTLCESGFDVRGVTRSIENISLPHQNCDYISLGELDDNTDWTNALDKVDVVIHCAGRAHVQHDVSDNPLDEFRKINVNMTLKLALAAAKSEVKRFIFLSSIGVNGNYNNSPFKEEDKPDPKEDYAISKLEAEQGLQEIVSKTNMDMVIIRPPLVYGPNAPGNFSTLMHWMNKNIPLPFGSIDNKRSFVALDNLINFIQTCIEHPSAGNQIFLVSDGDDLSTTELLSRVARSLGKQPRLISVNQKILEFFFSILGKKKLSIQLLNSLQIDISKAKDLLNWTPHVSVDDELYKTSQHFLRSKSS